MSAPEFPSAFGRSFSSVNTVGFPIVGGGFAPPGESGPGGGDAGGVGDDGVVPLSLPPLVSGAAGGVAVVPLPLSLDTPGIEKVGGGVCVCVSVDELPGTDVVPLSKGGVPEPTSCANAASGEQEKETASTTANSFLI
jgi:hypothetical protein